MSKLCKFYEEKFKVKKYNTKHFQLDILSEED